MASRGGAFCPNTAGVRWRLERPSSPFTNSAALFTPSGGAFPPEPAGDGGSCGAPLLPPAASPAHPLRSPLPPPP
eukprot:scaffold14801_cov105-Isochrysis_galbana.AAC.12